ncbi:carboxylesterase 5A-like [Centruroides vittatus]|uniref:carboxylesterase 5A-like n=1 Tax=Centruroides vittatus TaxID=120091 RepID=UPI00350FD368
MRFTHKLTNSQTQKMFLYLLAFAFGAVVRADVSATNGMLRGLRVETERGSVTKYLGIPYAQPPLGNLRFRPPIALNSALRAGDATRSGLQCPQPPHLKEVMSPLLFYGNMSNWSEDCLHLNIYVPESREVMPIMVWLAGEGFSYADPTQFDGTQLAALGKVIVVTVSYRVSVFGFLSSLTANAPGNIGLLDQRMALQWVHDNIRKFGGDPDRVTLFGRFTGAMAVSMHLASPLHYKERLFKRAIIQSGIATGSYIFEDKPKEALEQLTKLTGCDEAINSIECLQLMPADELLKAALPLSDRWRPVIDGHFLTEDPMTTFERGIQTSTDLLLGTNKDEGSICLLTLYFLNSPAYQDIIGNTLQSYRFKDLLKDNLLDYYKTENPILEEVAYDKYRYTDDSRKNLRDKYIQFCGDLYIKNNMEKLARLASVRNRVYVYQFDHRPSFSIQPPFISAAHGDDVLFTFGLAYQYANSTPEEKKLSLKTVAAFSNFAKNGHPEFENHPYLTWPRYTYVNKTILHFNVNMNENSTVSGSNDPIISFWENVVQALEHCKNTLTPVEDGRVYFLDLKLNTRTVECLIFVLVGVIVFLIVIVAFILRSACSNSKSEEAYRKL